MTSFAVTLKPTPFGFFDADADFQVEADGLVTFVRRKLGDDILSVELTKKQMWGCLEEAFLGVTYNAAKSILKSDKIGLIKEGYKADMLFFSFEKTWLMEW